MDLVDSNLKVLDMISVFGPYTKFLVEEISGQPTLNIPDEHYIDNLQMYMYVSNPCIHVYGLDVSAL